MNGLLIIGEEDRALESGARAAGLSVEYGDTPALPFERTLIVRSGTRAAWHLLPAAWQFLERWDAAVPLWRPGTTAADVGTAEERGRTAAIVGDLRVPLHAVELLFARDNDDGRALVAAYGEELASSREPRLAFLRALHRVKPRLCVLPASWLATPADSRLRGRPQRVDPLISVEVAPGRYVKCRAGDEEKVVAQFAQRRRRG
jgi:hypothetical protein